ncbi:MAG: hypothetical protein F4206_07930 [Gammaproteobacteria bacterium]|nr:hypothetical protein [Gammaproteobacteria bacterium]
MHRNTHGGIRGSLLDIPMKEEKDTPEEADGVLIDRRDAVRHLRSPASRNIVSVHPGGEGSGRPKLSITTLPQVRELTPGSDEIIRGPEPIRCVCGEVAFD